PTSSSSYGESVSSLANSVSERMSTRQPVRRAAIPAFWPPGPVGSGGEAAGETGVLALGAERRRELVVGDDHRRLLVLVVDEHLTHARGAERLGDEAGGLLVVGDDVDLLAPQPG